jgi:hypothetical protein
VPITREEIERRMNELARKYVDTHDPELTKELYELAGELERMKKRVKGRVKETHESEVNAVP